MLNDLTFYQERFNLQNARFNLIVHEDAIVAIVYHVFDNGNQYILKICEREFDYLRELYFLQHFVEKIPVPHILQHVEPSSNMPGAILMEFLPGTLLSGNIITESLAKELGGCLAKIHLNRLEGYGDPVKKPLSNNPEAYFTFKLEEGLEECKSLLPENLIEKCRVYYESHLNLLDAVDGPCIVHRDYRPGNIIVSNGELQGIIDWAGARASFAEEDLCFLEHGEWSKYPHILKPFLEGYQTIRPLPDYTRLISFLRLNKAVATLGFIAKCKTSEARDAKLYRYNLAFLESLK